MARTFLEVDGITDVAGNGTEIFGQTGNEKVTLLDGYTGFVLDQNIEEVGFQGNYADYTFEQQGINLNVKNSAGDVMATIAVQNDDNGTQFTFADGTVDVVFDGTTIVVGDEPVDPVDPGDTFTLQEIEGTPEKIEPVLYWGYTPDQDEGPQGNGIPAAELIDFLNNINIDLVQLGVIDDDGVDPNEVIESITIGDINVIDDSGQNTVTIDTVDGRTISAEASLGENYLDFLSDLIFDAEGNSRLHMVDEVTQEEIPGSAIVLTPSENNGGTLEDGTTSDADDTIIAGQTELLHGAYIDGGDGYDTLEVDMKGVYAQPLELLNIEEVHVQNLPNVYTDSSDESTYPDLSGSCQINSILDLSRATSIEKLVVTEGDFDGLNEAELGTLTIAGIRNGVTTTLDGGFSKDVTLHYSSESDDAGLNLVFYNLSMGDGDQDAVHLNVAQNVETLNIESIGADNFLADGNLGGELSTLNITGDAQLYIAGSLDDSFQAANPATIDASANTGGVNLTINGYADQITFNGTAEAYDRFTADDNGKAVIINGGNGNNEFSADNGTVVTITAGDGDNSISAQGASTSTTVETGDGNNTINTDGSNTVDITTGTGDDEISAVGVGKATLDAGAGDNDMTVSGEDLDITSGAGDDKLTLAGTAGDLSVAAQAGLNLMLILDDSSSMSGSSVTALKTGVNGMLDNLENSGIDTAAITVVFASSATSSSWGTIDEARATVDSLMGNSGMTNYFNAIESAKTAWDEPGKIDGANNVSVFVSDGYPTEGDPVDSDAWETFLANNGIVSNAIGVGTFDTSELDIIAYDGVNDTDMDPVLTDADGLSNLLSDIGEEIVGVSGKQAVVNIDLGEGTNTLLLGDDDELAQGLVALEGSSITGDNIKMIVNQNSDLRAASLSGIESVVLDNADVGSADRTVDNAMLTLTADQFAEIGAENFSVEGSAFNTAAELKIIVTEDTSLTDLGVDDLPDNIDLQLEVADGVTLEMTAQQLHEKVAEDGVIIADDNNDDLAPGEVYISDAGNDFDPYATGVGSLDDGIGCRIDQDATGYERPDQVPVDLSRWQHNSDEDGPQITADQSTADLLLLEGDADLTMVPVARDIDDWGVETEPVTAIEMNVDGGKDGKFYVDFSDLNGQLIDMTLARFEDVAAVYGNGNDARLNVELTGDVATSDVGLISSGVETYVVTDLNGADRAFWTCETTQDLVTLGLQDNYGNSITFGNVDHGVNFLMEAVYDKANGSAAVGILNADFARAGADAAVNIVDADGRLADDESIMVQGIDIDNAESITVNAGADAVIEALGGDTVKDLTFVSEYDLTVQTGGDIPVVDGAFDLDTVDASNVAGTFTFEIMFEGFDHNFTNTTLTGIDEVVLHDNTLLSLTAEQIEAIGSENFIFDGDEGATVNIADLSDQPFSRDNFDEDITVTVTLADDEEITLHEDTDLTDIGTLTVAEDTTLTLDGDQLVQLVTTGGNLTGDGRVVVSDFNQTHMDALGEWAAENDDAFDFGDAFAAGLDRVTLNVDGDLEISSYEGSDHIDRPVEIIADLKDTLSFELNEYQLTLATVDQADELLVNNGNVKFTFVDSNNDGDNDGDDLIEVGLADFSTEDAAGGDFQFNADSLGDNDIWVANIANFSAGDVLNINDEYLAADNMLFAVTGTDEINFAFGDMNDFVPTFTINLTDVDEAVVSAVEAAAGDTIDGDDTADIINVLQDAWGEDWLIDYDGDGGEDDGNTSIDMTGYTNIGEVEVYALLINRNDNIEDLFLNLESSIQDLENVIRVVDTPVGLSLDRAVILEAGVTTVGDMQFITADAADNLDNVANVWINLTGDSTIDGDIVLDANELAEGTFDTLTIVSYGDDANTITGGITADGNAIGVAGVAGTAENNLLNVVIDADADLVIAGDIVFQSKDDEGVATLTLNGTGNVTLAGLDTDDDVDGLSINMESLDGTLTLTDPDDDNGDIDYDWTGIDDLTITGNSDTNPIVLDENVTLKLTAEQANGLFIEPAAGADTETITIDIIDLNNDATYDFTGIDADIAGEITLNTEAVDDGGAEGRVQLEAGTDLGDFSVHLFDDQLIGFMTPAQADGQVVTVEDTETGNIAWLFDELSTTVTVIDASGYSGAIDRLFINDDLAINNPAVEQLWSGLSPNIELINIRYTGDLNFGVVNLDRTFEVSGFANLNNGLALLEGEDAQYYENVTIKLGGGADVASLTLDNIVAAALADDDQVFDTLTIESGSFDTDEVFDPITNVFAPDNWDPDGGFGDPTDNTIGDIASGDGLRLVNVSLDTVDLAVAPNDTDPDDTELPLNVGIITFDGDTDINGDPIAAKLDLNGGKDITIESLEAGENINSIVQNVSDFAGTLNITGGSPAIFGDALESIEISGDNEGDDAGFGSTINIGQDESDAFPGVDTDALTEFDAEDYAGTLNLQLSDVNGAKFTFTAGSGQSIVTLDGDMELAKDGDWKFDFSDANAKSELIITNEVTLGDGKLTIDDITVRIEGDVNLSAFDGLNIEDSDLVIAEGAKLTATQAQLEMFGEISNEDGKDGDGMLVIVPNAGEDTITGFDGVWNYDLDPSIAGAALTFKWGSAPADANLNRIGTTHVVTIADVGDAHGTWSGFKATDVLYVADGDSIEINGVNAGGTLGGIGSIHVHDDNAGEVTMTAAQHAVLDTAVAGSGTISGGELTIELAEVVNGVTGIDGVAAYKLFNDTEGNTFTVAATDQAVTAGDQGDTLNANTGADTFNLGDGEDTVVYTGAAQSYVVGDLGKTPAPTVVAGSPDLEQITDLTFVENQIADQGVIPGWEYILEIKDTDDNVVDTVSYTLLAGDGLNEVINGLFGAVNASAQLSAAGVESTGFSFGDRTLTIEGDVGVANQFTVNVTVEDDANASKSVSNFINGAASNGLDSGTDTQNAADQTGGTIAITISDDNAALVDALNLEIDDVRINDYTGIDFDQATNGTTLADELEDNGLIASAVYANDTGVLTLTAAPGSSIDIAEGFDAPLVDFDFDSINEFDDVDEDLLNLSSLSLTAGNFVGDIDDIDTGITTADLYEAAQEAAGLIDKGDFGYFALDGDTYVFADIGAKDDQANSDDFLVELNGVMDLTTDDFLLA